MGESSRRVVSLVITSGDRPRHLAEAVRSATARLAAVEVIVVHDWSRPEAAAAARNFPDVLLVQQSNRGVAAARNRGLGIASGDYVIFLDADDVLLPGGIDIGARALATHAECAMAYGRCVMIGPDGQLSVTPDGTLVRSGHHAALLRTNYIWMPATAIFRREALVAAGGFSEGIDGAADYDLYLRISRTAAVHDHGCVVAGYRHHDPELNGHAARMLRDTLTVMQRNRPEPGSELHCAWREGYGRWQDIYGRQLVEEIRDDVHDHAFADGCRKALVLARHAPWVFVRELGSAIRVRARYPGNSVNMAPRPGAGL